QQQPMPTHPTAGGWQDKLDQIVAKAKQIIMTTNPVYFLVLGVIIIGMAGFLAYAFQAGLIKTGTTVKSKGPTDTTPPVITMITVKAGQGNSAIISWVTDKYSSSQVQWGVYPAPNQLTPIQNDPTTGQNMGVLIHQVAITPLAQNMDYMYRVISVDKDGNKAVSPPMTAPPMSLHTTSFQSN
ncbi:MAG: fibronectin type III domain-containing protein, partial [Chloroflexi bacterium]|nr:fibronectin type III domain-containing protein [Chloroflexota bacterium]